MKYQPVTVQGTTSGDEILVLSGTRDLGGWYQVISAFQTQDGRRIMIDRGFIPQDDRRKPRPCMTREGDWWIGMGVASAARVNMLRPAAARVRLEPDGSLRVESDQTDIGTGSYAILGQIAGDLLDRHGVLAGQDQRRQTPVRRQGGRLALGHLGLDEGVAVARRQGLQHRMLGRPGLQQGAARLVRPPRPARGLSQQLIGPLGRAQVAAAQA